MAIGWKSSVTALASFLVSVFCALPTAHAQPSSYPASCRNISISGATLTASCRRIDGTYNKTSILLQGIANTNGVLTADPGQAASFQNSCRQIEVAGATLTASCRRIDGTYNNTSFLIPGIANINGVLQY